MATSGFWRGIGRSLKNRNFRVYLVGQGVSHAGMWIQMVAELWLILEITDSGAALGIHSVLRFAPILIFGVFAGVIGDRVDRRNLLLVTQGVHTLSAGTLAVVVWLTTPTVALIYAIVMVQGIINAIDNPVRRSFIRDLTSDDEIANAVSLHNTVGTMTRAIGPAIAGILIATLGAEWCFGINAVSYLGVLISLWMIDRSRLRPATPVVKGPGLLRAGFRYAWAHVPIRVTLLLTFVVAVFAWQWSVILPVYSKDEFGGDAALFGFFVSVLSVGSVLGALYTARLTKIGGRHLRTMGTALAIALALCTFAPTMPIAFIGVAALGAAGSAFNIGAQSRIQLAVDDAMTTRVMALYSVGFTGSKPIGGILAGVMMDASSSRVALLVGSLAVGMAVIAYVLTHRSRQARRARESESSQG